MSRGRETKYAPHGVPSVPIPDRVKVLKHDYFYPCERCGDLYPRRKLRREPVTKMLVCKNDYDIPSVHDVEESNSYERSFDRFDRLGHNIEEND